MAKPRYTQGASLKDKKGFASFLSEDEELVVAAGYGRTYLRNKFVLYLLVALGVFLPLSFALSKILDFNLNYSLSLGFLTAVLMAVIKTLWLYHSHRYLLTTRRVIIKNGFFAVKLSSALYDKITHLEVDQSFIDRLVYRHGTVIIHTAGSNKDEMKIEYIDTPIEFKNILERLINQERTKYTRSVGVIETVEGELVE